VADNNVWVRLIDGHWKCCDQTEQKCDVNRECEPSKLLRSMRSFFMGEITPLPFALA
jgi:hypothetical protein